MPSKAIVPAKQKAPRRLAKLPKDFEPLVTSVINGEPWFSDGAIMLKGVPDRKGSRAEMFLVWQQALKGPLVPTEGFRRNDTAFRTSVHESIAGNQFIASKYYFMIDAPKWKSFIGGKFHANPYGGERYIVVKEGNEVVAIVAPLRRP